MFEFLDGANPIAIGMGAIAGLFGFWMAGRMIDNFLWIFLSGMASGIVGFLIASKVGDN